MKSRNDLSVPPTPRPVPREGAFIGHPSGVPLEVSKPSELQAGTEDAAHLGGLAFDSAEAVESGAQLLLRFPSLDPDFVARACVAWCDVTDGGYRIGVTFFDAGDAFRSRMLEQICAIQAHARTLRENDDQERTDNEVACEWIDRSGSAFPNP